MAVAAALRAQRGARVVRAGDHLRRGRGAAAARRVSFALYEGRYSFGSFDEAKLLVVVTVVSDRAAGACCWSSASR
ncbi:hypothetical protein QJS66_00205 [Kocuria rhizophila]|nr:hypothetical protein QJS66_00205 [Kocuria rhizophila]